MRVCTYILLQVFIDSYVCVAAHGLHERFTIRIVIRCDALVAKGSGGTLAGGSWLIELSSQPVCSRELPGLQVRRATSGLRSVRPSEGTASCGLRSGRAGARNASRSGQWARLAGTAAASCAALHQGVEARAGENAEEQEELSGVESDGATDQFCRLGIDAAGGTGRAPGTTVEGDIRLSRRPRRHDRAGPVRSGARAEEARKWSQRIDAETNPALAGSDAAQELGLSRAARANCRWIDAASVHRLLLRGGAQARRVSARLHPTDTADAQSRQRPGGSGGGRARIRGRCEAAGRHHGGAERHPSSDR